MSSGVLWRRNNSSSEFGKRQYVGSEPVNRREKVMTSSFLRDCMVLDVRGLGIYQ